ncbi:Kinase, CMGC DYRK [Spironucleus salmonicida]|uniref:dual-specificity kinase n=1 Tax=Spironucleus salmonicida TaxID=348837 RepID=V6LWD4_9EUKA|nr:Kinase, CMGC DYRK [Spironucleus salmonicida]|eukprot:EST48021.1 Kinase, CMGC DYRK [Spironucleus salmonicida]
MSNFRKFKEAPVQLPHDLMGPPQEPPKRSQYRGRRNVQIPKLQTVKAAIISQLPFQDKITTLPAQQEARSSSVPSNVKLQSILQQQPKTPSKTGAYILQYHQSELSQHEKEEILQFSKIYYWGQKAQKPYNVQATNYGYDDQRGDYLGVIKDHVSYRYELISILGQGSFGKVFKAYDHATSTQVALKIVRNKKRFHRQGIVEVRLLETLRKNDSDGQSNSVIMTSSFYFRQHLIMVFEQLSINLYELLLKFDLRGLNTRLVRKFAVQTLNCLNYSFNLKIIHADIKPENILIVAPDSSKCKIIDWGSGAFVNQTIYTYIQSRFYRAPEVILGLPYSIEIDIWSLGCVFCELLNGTPIFAGENETDQLGKICEVLGMPPQDMILKSPRKGEFFNAGKLRSGHRPSNNLKQRVKDQGLFSIVEKMLVWDPSKRAKPFEVMQSPWIQEGIRELEMRIQKELGKGAPVQEQVEDKPIQQVIMDDGIGFKVVMKQGVVELPKIGM